MLKYPSIENYYNVFKNKYLTSFMDDVFYATELSIILVINLLVKMIV